MYKYELVFTILNRGFSDLVMDSARSNGATGGTIVTARGTGAEIAEKLFGISISEEKEIVLILIEREKRNALMRGICDVAGLSTRSCGITFSIPVDEVAGGTFGTNGLTLDVLNETDGVAADDESGEAADGADGAADEIRAGEENENDNSSNL